MGGEREAVVLGRVGGGGEREHKFGPENGALLNSSNHFLLFWCTFLLTMKKSLLTRNFRSYQT